MLALAVIVWLSDGSHIYFYGILNIIRISDKYETIWLHERY